MLNGTNISLYISSSNRGLISEYSQVYNLRKISSPVPDILHNYCVQMWLIWLDCSQISAVMAKSDLIWRIELIMNCVGSLFSKNNHAVSIFIEECNVVQTVLLSILCSYWMKELCNTTVQFKTVCELWLLYIDQFWNAKLFEITLWAM